MKAVAALFALALAVVSSAACRTHGPASPPATPNASPEAGSVLTSQEGVWVMRMVADYEVVEIEVAKSFATLDQLRTSVEWKAEDARPDSITHKVTPIDDISASMPGYTLRVVVSPDRKHYDASLTATDACRRSWLVDERGLIYVGANIGCDDHPAKAK